MPSATNVANYNMGMQTFNMGTISNSTGAPNPSFIYNDYTTTHVVAYNPGDYVNFSSQVGPGNNTQVSIYIDWNSDKTFDASERVAVSGIVNAGATYSGGFQISASQNPGIFRMRVVGDFGSAPANSPCQLNYSGEVEDYTFVVKSPSIDILAFDAPSKLEMGNNSIYVTLGNISASDVVNSYDIGYRLDNGSVTTQSFSGQTLASGNFVTKNFSTPLNISTTGVYTLKVWARNPNGQGAGINTNDTIYRTFEVCNKLSGLFTINANGAGASNFKTFNAAITKLITCGVNGPVRFEVAAGTYNEQFEIPEIDGVSATNTITFDGVNAASRTISFNTNDASNRHIIRLNGAKYMEFRNFTIATTSASYGWPVHILSEVQFVKFAKNIIRTYDYNNSTGSTNFIPVVMSNSPTSYSTGMNNTNNITLDSNTISGGYFNVVVYGSGTNSNVNEIKIRHNTMDNFYYYGMYGVNFINLHYTNNRVSQKLSTTTGGYGVYLSSINASGSYQTIIDGNDVQRAFQYGMYLTSVNNNSQRGQFTNNIVGQGLVNVSSFGAYFSNCSNFDVWHNTLTNYASTTNAESAALYMTNSNSADIRNNILQASSVGASAYALNITTTAAISVLDYNNYTKLGADNSTPIIKLATNLISTNDMKAAFGFNHNSLSEAPLFVSQSNLRLSAIASSPFGDPNLGISKDIDGNNRCAKFPSIGASESAYNTSSNPQIFVSDTVFVDAPTKIFNSAAVGEPKNHTWDIDNGAAIFTTLHIDYTFTQAGVYTISLQTESCAGTASASKQVRAVVPVDPPTTAFISTGNQVDQGYPISFIDQSTGGASAWVWTITPASGVQFVNGANVQNPEVVFNQTGSYEVCLIASNSAGQGNQLCKAAYIQVTEANNLCSGKVVSKSSTGKVFDEGGRFGDYGNGRDCGFLIDPCASSVTLSFVSFNLDQGDYLRIYDGSDDNGKPLHTGAGFTGTIIPTDLTANTGKMYVKLISNATGTRAGFEAAWTSTTKAFNAPVAAFRAPDTLYTGTNFTFISNSTGTDPDITWDFNNDQVIDAQGEIASYTFQAPGTYLVRLAIADCGGTDGAVKAITVIDPTTSPIPDFVSDYRTITVGQLVHFYDRSSQSPSNWEWKISPATYNFTEGTDAYSQNPVIAFTAVGNYNITLVASNAFGTDSTLKTAAIRVVEYCYPGAGLNTDLGITRVTFAGIDNVSLVGPQTYTDYSRKVKSASVQKGAKYPITILRASNNEEMSRKVWIDYNGDGIFSPSEEVASQAADKTLSWTDTILIPTNVSEGSTRMRIGVSYGVTNNSPCGVNPFGEFEDYTITIYENLTRPVITLIGSEVVRIEVGSNYSDSGAIAIDDLDGNLTANLIGSTNVNTQMVGTYFYRYNVSDNNGNSAEVTRTIFVTPDITPPQLTLKGNNPFNLILGTAFQDPGADAFDTYDGVIPSNMIQVTGFVNSLQIGLYTLTYTVYDKAGNMTSDTRTVLVGDTSIPTIYLKGADTIYIALGTNYVDPGALVVDNNSTAISYQVDLSVIDNQTVGNYTLIYTAADSSGNQANPVNRIVGVRDYTAPMLSLLGDTVVMEVNTTYNEPGYTVSDNYDVNFAVQVTGSVDNTKTGLYLLFYDVTDASGNKANTRYRLVQVRDTKAPVIVLNGDKILTLCRWEKYVDPGFVVTDNYDLNVEVEVESNLDNSWEGLYSIRYTARDKSGNVAIAVDRLIRVIDCATGTEELEANQITIYPNPSKGKITLHSVTPFAAEPALRVVDALGKAMTFKAQTTQEGIEIDIQNAATGIYFIQVQMNGEWTSHKVQIIK